MATSYSAITSIPKGSVFGNMRVNMGRLTINATGGSSYCGLKVVCFAALMPSVVTSGYMYALTSGAVVVASATSADSFFVMAIGQ